MRKSIFLAFFSFLSTFYEQSTILGSVLNLKILGKENNIKKNDFLKFDFTMKNIKKIKYNKIFSKFYIFS